MNEKETELYAVEELEDRLIAEAIKYFNYNYDLVDEEDYEEIGNYWDAIIGGKMLDKFVRNLHSKLEQLDQDHALKYLSISLNQFNSHSPEIRIEQLKNRFWIVLYAQYPPKDEAPKKKIDDFTSNYLNEVFSYYSKYFENYKEALIRLTDEFKSGLYTRLNSNNIKLAKIETSLSVDELAYLVRALIESNIITNKNKSDVYRTVCATFSSKQRVDIKEKSLSNKFTTPGFKAMDRWLELFSKLMTFTRTEKNSKTK